MGIFHCSYLIFPPQILLKTNSSQKLYPFLNKNSAFFHNGLIESGNLEYIQDDDAAACWNKIFGNLSDGIIYIQGYRIQNQKAAIYQIEIFQKREDITRLFLGTS